MAIGSNDSRPLSSGRDAAVSYQSMTKRERLLAWCDCMDRSRRRAAITLAPREDQPPEYRELADKAARGEISMALAAPLLVEIADRYL